MHNGYIILYMTVFNKTFYSDFSDLGGIAVMPLKTQLCLGVITLSSCKEPKYQCLYSHERPISSKYPLSLFTLEKLPLLKRIALLTSEGGSWVII